MLGRIEYEALLPALLASLVGDFTTRHRLEEMIVDTEEHIDWFETQLCTIKQVGLERYLA
mgnify:CR=1 FL=1